MSVFNKMQQLQKLHDLIKEGKSGRPEILANNLGVNRSTLYMLIEELKSFNYEISYSRSKKKFIINNDKSFCVNLN